MSEEMMDLLCFASFMFLLVGNRIPASQVNATIVEKYRADTLNVAEETMKPYISLCHQKQIEVEEHLIEGDLVQKELVDQIFKLGLTKLVLGTSNANSFAKVLRGESILEFVARNAPKFCTVMVIHRGRFFLMKEATELLSSTENDINSSESSAHVETGSQGSADHEPIQTSRINDVQGDGVHVPLWVTHLLKNQLFVRHQDEMEMAMERERMQMDAENIIIDSANRKIREFGRNRGEAWKEAMLTRRQSGEDARKHEALHRNMAEETLRVLHELISRTDGNERKLAEERVRREEALTILEDLMGELGREAQLRKEAEGRALAESIAKDNAIAALGKVQSNSRVLQRKYTNYSFEEIQKATDNFARNNKLGEGGYGPVFKGKLHHMTVAIKLLARDGVHGREEFQREVELLGHIHHPHMVMLVGACPEKGCIVYEYMANGSLEDRLECKGGSAPLPWYVRFRICSEVATALLFLHSRPKPIVHRDLKPGNILLDHNFVSKVSDVGIAKLVPNNMTFNITMYKETALMGTVAYIDPDYQRTGVVSCESDVYALGIVMLQILTRRPAVGVTGLVEEAIKNNKLHEVLDESAGNWPLEKATELARLALECAQPLRRHRPKLESKVLPTLEKLRAYANEVVTTRVLSHGAGPVIPSVYPVSDIRGGSMHCS